MKHNSAAKLYAKALFEVAQERKDLSAVSEELQAVAMHIQESQDLRQVLNGVNFSTQEKEAVINELADKMKLQPLVKNFLHLLAQKNRLLWLIQIQQHFTNFVDDSENLVRGIVTTAEKISEQQVQDLERAFGKKFSRSVKLSAQEDKNILGGLVVQVQGLTFDGSLKTALQRLKDNLERQYV